MSDIKRPYEVGIWDVDYRDRANIIKETLNNAYEKGLELVCLSVEGTRDDFGKIPYIAVFKKKTEP